MREGARTAMCAGAAAPRRLEDYRGIAPDGLLDATQAHADAIDGARILHVSTTADGGGAGELLASEVGLLRDLGIEAEWRLIRPDPEFFRAAKLIQDALRGQPVSLDARDLHSYLEHNRRCAALLADDWDVIVVHGTTPAALIASAAAPSAAWVWRCQIDASAPDPAAWELLRAFLLGYDAFVFPLPEFCPPRLDRERLAVIAPAIDPLSRKNRPLPAGLARRIVAGYGVDPDRPLVVQVARFDRWQDPLVVVAAWRLARAQVPGLQLALLGSLAADDPDAWAVYERLRRASAGERDCHLLTNLAGIGSLELNAFQREADVVVEQSLREGFGRAVSEALWKETPVVGSNTGGIPLELGGDGGLAGDDVAGCAAAIVALLENGSLAGRLARAGRDSVGREFLTPRLVRDQLALYGTLLAAPKPPAPDRTIAAAGAR